MIHKCDEERGIRSNQHRCDTLGSHAQRFASSPCPCTPHPIIERRESTDPTEIGTKPTNKFLNKANYSPKQSSQQTLGTCSNLLCSKMSGNAVPPSDEGQLTARSDRQHQQRERCGFPIRTSARQHLVTFGAVVRHRECLPQTHITT